MIFSTLLLSYGGMCASYDANDLPLEATALKRTKAPLFRAHIRSVGNTWVKKRELCLSTNFY
jgi:hypothetical protein